MSKPETSSNGDLVVTSAASSGLSINLHPLPILNISEHYTRARLSQSGAPRLMGALLGTLANRAVSITNSFELIYGVDSSGTDGMDLSGQGENCSLNTEFLESRREQFKQVFPTLDVVGWYSIGLQPTADDVLLHKQFENTFDSPVFLLFHPSTDAIQNLPCSVYESALVEGSKGESAGKFVQLEYGVETGEAERIAVDGISRGTLGVYDDASVVGNLTTQRNAIRMLHERVTVLQQYIHHVINNTVPPDYAVIRKISSLVSSLPTIDAAEYQQELFTEYSDVQLTTYLSTLTKQLGALGEYSDKYHILYPGTNDEYATQAGPRGGRPFGGAIDFGAGRRRRV